MLMVTFKEEDNLNEAIAQENPSMLTQYFVANWKGAWARNIPYKDVPRMFTWQPTKYGTWVNK
jgi:hypothetical protein